MIIKEKTSTEYSQTIARLKDQGVNGAGWHAERQCHWLRFNTIDKAFTYANNNPHVIGRSVTWVFLEDL